MRRATKHRFLPVHPGVLRLGKFFGMEVQFWMNLQSHYDLEVMKDALGRGLPQGSRS